MQTASVSEGWLRGPVPEVPALLQPVAHALLQAQEELHKLTLPPSLLWERPGGVASVGFHLQHLTGVLDRLFTYARTESLDARQLDYLQNEGKPPHEHCTFQDLLGPFNHQLKIALDQLKNTAEQSLTEIRYVGRAQIPSTHMGLLFHAAEHTQRHLGQLLVTVQILNAGLE